MSEKLTIKLTKAERKHSGCVIGYEFFVSDGTIAIRECWESHDEIYSDGITVAVPARIWAEALPWLAERLPASLGNGRAG